MKKNKSRLTKTDVDSICQLQRKVDAYEMYLQRIMNCVCTERQITDIVLMHTPMDDVVQMIYSRIRLMKEKAGSLKEVTPGQ